MPWLHTTSARSVTKQELWKNTHECLAVSVQMKDNASLNPLTVLSLPSLPQRAYTHELLLWIYTWFIMFTQKAATLLSYRWYSYKKLKFQYFLFDFCYFTNFLTLLYIWIPSSIIGESYRGELFTMCFSFSMGPLLSAIVLWRNSLVPHSADKMTSLFIHISPALTLWGIRW